MNRLNLEIARALARADVKEKFLAIGVEAVSSTPEVLAALIKSEMDRMGRLIKAAGIRAD